MTIFSCCSADPGIPARASGCRACGASCCPSCTVRVEAAVLCRTCAAALAGAAGASRAR